jgi:hypothetical protein
MFLFFREFVKVLLPNTHVFHDFTSEVSVELYHFTLFEILFTMYPNYYLPFAKQKQLHWFVAKNAG